MYNIIHYSIITCVCRQVSTKRAGGLHGKKSISCISCVDITFCLVLMINDSCSSDLIEGLVLLMQSNYTNPVNLGNPDEYTILDFAKTILKSVG